MKARLWAWALIDWGNSAFALVVMTAFFPIAFKDLYAAGVPAERSTWWLGLFNSAAGLGIAMAAPLLGALADRRGFKRSFLLAFTLLGAASTLALCLAARGQALLAGALFALASLGFAGNNLFYDALLADAAEPRDYDRASALGYALGYLGGLLLFSANAHMVSRPQAWGLASAEQGLKLAFAATAVWWLLFTLPALFVITERTASAPRRPVERRAWRESVRAVCGNRPVLRFLLAYALYIDGVNTVIKMAVDYGKALGLGNQGLLQALALTQLVAFPASLAAGRLAERFGARPVLHAGLMAYALACLWAWRLEKTWEFTALAVLIGLVQGGVQALSRSLYARLVPEGRFGEYFGLYNTIGRFASILGPALLGLTALCLGSRASVLSLLLLFGSGAWLLAKVDVRAQGGERARNAKTQAMDKTRFAS